MRRVETFRVQAAEADPVREWVEMKLRAFHKAQRTGGDVAKAQREYRDALFDATSVECPRCDGTGQDPTFGCGLPASQTQPAEWYPSDCSLCCGVGAVWPDVAARYPRREER